MVWRVSGIGIGDIGNETSYLGFECICFRYKKIIDFRIEIHAGRWIVEECGWNLEKKYSQENGRNTPRKMDCSCSDRSEMYFFYLEKEFFKD